MHDGHAGPAGVTDAAKERQAPRRIQHLVAHGRPGAHTKGVNKQVTKPPP